MYQTATDMYHEEAQDPEDEQNHRDRPQHVFFLDKGWTSLALPLGNSHTAIAAPSRRMRPALS